MTIAVGCACVEADLQDEEDFKRVLIARMREIGNMYPHAGYGFAEADGVIEITETPASFDDKEAADLFIDMLAKLAGGEGNPEVSKEIVFERALYQVCCKGAIKANDKNDKAALLSLIERMYMHPDITYCPHGRPVAFRMSRAALERRFGRT